MEVQITDSEEVEGWLKNSVGRPRRILAVLHRAGAGANLGGVESPPPNRVFPHIKEDDSTIIDVPAEDSDYEEGNHRINAKGMRVYSSLTRTDASNQRLIQTLVRRCDRQQDAIDDIDPKYLRKYPLGVGVADPNFVQGLLVELVVVVEAVEVLEAVVEVLEAVEVVVEAVEVLEAVVEVLLEAVVVVMVVVVIVVVVMVVVVMAPRALWTLRPANRMPPNKRSAGSVLLSAKRPRLPVPPEEHDDSQTDGSEISYRALTALSISTRSSQSTISPIVRKGLLRSSDTSTGRSSPRRAEFHLPDGNTDSAEVQEQQEDVPEEEETGDTSYSVLRGIRRQRRKGPRNTI
ncbi:hypothetical protein DFP73DRAFT_593514 [Morchella snyderi]|nr:hypothetical protein DFP73DRAFT_593514 [Morchella snyderi]